VTTEPVARPRRKSNPEIAARRQATLTVRPLIGRITAWNERAAMLRGLASARSMSGKDTAAIASELTHLRSEVESHRAAFREIIKGNSAAPVENVGAALDRLIDRLSNSD
jgi:hypothetical protein